MSTHTAWLTYQKRKKSKYEKKSAAFSKLIHSNGSLKGFASIDDDDDEVAVPGGIVHSASHALSAAASHGAALVSSAAVSSAALVSSAAVSVAAIPSAGAHVARNIGERTSEFAAVVGSEVRGSLVRMGDGLWNGVIPHLYRNIRARSDVHNHFTGLAELLFASEGNAFA